jgi:hypothetical protein
LARSGKSTIDLAIGENLARIREVSAEQSRTVLLTTSRIELPPPLFATVKGERCARAISAETIVAPGSIHFKTWTIAHHERSNICLLLERPGR